MPPDFGHQRGLKSTPPWANITSDVYTWNDGKFPCDLWPRHCMAPLSWILSSTFSLLASWGMWCWLYTERLSQLGDPSLDFQTPEDILHGCISCENTRKNEMESSLPTHVRHPLDLTSLCLNRNHERAGWRLGAPSSPKTRTCTHMFVRCVSEHSGRQMWGTCVV